MNRAVRALTQVVSREVRREEILEDACLDCSAPVLDNLWERDVH